MLISTTSPTVYIASVACTLSGSNSLHSWCNLTRMLNAASCVSHCMCHLLPSPPPHAGTSEDDVTQQIKRDYYRLNFVSSLDDDLTQSSGSSSGQRCEERDGDQHEEGEESGYAPIHPPAGSMWGRGQQQGCPSSVNVGVATSATPTHLSSRESDDTISQEDASRHRQPEALLEPSPLLTRTVVATPNPMGHRYENIFDLGAMTAAEELADEQRSSNHDNHKNNPVEVKRVPSPSESVSSSGYYSAFVASNLTMNLYPNMEYRPVVTPLQTTQAVYDLPLQSVSSSSSHGNDALSHPSSSGHRAQYVNQEVIELQKKWQHQRRLKLMLVKEQQQTEEEGEEGDSEGHYGSFLKLPRPHSKPTTGEGVCSVEWHVTDY